jgi:hypothetical protein
MAYGLGTLGGVLLLGGISGYIAYRVTLEPSTTKTTKTVLWVIALGFTAMGLLATKAYLSVLALWAGIGIGSAIGRNKAKTMDFDSDAAANETKDLERR